MLASLMVIAFGNGVVLADPADNQGPDSEATAVLAYTPHDAIWIDGNAEMVAQATAEMWPGNGSESAPYMITGYYFDQYTQPLRIWNTDLHWVFSGNEVTGDPTVQCGTWITNCSNGVISDNYIHGRHAGMWLEDLTNFSIIDNIVSNNRAHAIEIAGVVRESVISGNTIDGNLGSGIRITAVIDSVVSENSITDCDGAGIQVLSTADASEFYDNDICEVTSIGLQLGYSTSVHVERNSISNATASGIYILGSESCTVFNNSVSNGQQNGIRFTNCNFGSIENNTVSDCLDAGISVSSGTNSTFRFNRVHNTGQYGFELGASSSNMTITRNAFYSCGSNCQILDDGTDNMFIFNFYNDWSSPDENLDGIVDNPYSADGSSLNLDPYPLSDPNIVPVTPTSGTETGTGTSEGEGFPLNLAVVAAGALVVIVLGGFFVRRKL